MTGSASNSEVQGRSSACHSRTPKPFRSYREQVERLVERGMDVGDEDQAAMTLRLANYYRLSGYWYPFRNVADGGRGDTFLPGARLSDVWALHEFDGHLRAATFGALGRVERYMRARLAHELGRLDPCAHLKPERLSITTPKDRNSYQSWLRKYQLSVRDSREDFAAHHRRTKGGLLPVWAAVELLDWGSLAWLFSFSPRDVKDEVASDFRLSGAQLNSWLKCLNIVRNVCAHHSRFYNRVHALKPKMPDRGQSEDLDEVRGGVERIGPGKPGQPGYSEHWFGERTFGQLTLVQHMLHAPGWGECRRFPG